MDSRSCSSRDIYTRDVADRSTLNRRLVSRYTVVAGIVEQEVENPLLDAYMEQRAGYDFSKLKLKNLGKLSRLIIRALSAGADWRKRLSKDVASSNLTTVVDFLTALATRLIADDDGVAGTGIAKPTEVATRLYPGSWRVARIQIDETYEKKREALSIVTRLTARYRFDYAPGTGPTRVERRTRIDALGYRDIVFSNEDVWP